MSVYAIAVFLHIVGALALFAAIGLEWAGVQNLRRASRVAQVHEWIRLLLSLRRVDGPAALVILVTGIYLSASGWGHQPWIGMGVVGLLLMGALGGVITGRRVAAVHPTIPAEGDAIPEPLRSRLQDPMLRLSVSLRMALRWRWCS